MRKNSMTFFNIYFIFSIAYYLFGRYCWNIPSYPKLLIYLIICYMMLNVGYRLSWLGKGILRKGLYREYNFQKDTYNRVRALFWVSAISLIVFQVVWVIVFFDHFSFTNVFAMLGDNYYARLNTTFDSSIPIMQVRTLCWGITLFVYPIGFIYFKDMPFLDRVLFVITVIIDIFAALNMGVSKNIGDLVIVFIGIVFLKNVVNISLEANKQRRKGMLKIVLVILAFLLVFGTVQRIRDVATTGSIINPYGSFAIRRNATIFSLVFGEQIGAIIDKIGLYISHAYTGLAYSLEIPFKNTYLLGFSRSLMEYAEQYLGLKDLALLTYNERIESMFGWHNGQWWPTAFVWIGNSVSMWLVPVVMLILGVFIRHLEDDYAATGNIITAALYVQMIITLFYLPCNMQIFQSRASLMGSLFLFCCFFIRKRIYRKMGENIEC